MTKKELVSIVADTFRQNNIKKPISIPKQVFSISDGRGNCKDFVVESVDKTVIYTIDDVALIIDTCLMIIEDAIKRGEEVRLHGFGSFGVHQRAARKTKHPYTGEIIDVHERYVPKFTFGNNLRTAAHVYELSLIDSNKTPIRRCNDFIKEESNKSVVTTSMNKTTHPIQEEVRTLTSDEIDFEQYFFELTGEKL